MGLFFRENVSGSCCLCGELGKPTGEHKIKASELLKEFGQAKLTIRNSSDPSKRKKQAQSVKSKHLKFSAKICEPCNSARTQGADRELEQFTSAARAILAKGRDPASVFELARYTKGSTGYLNVFRYFSKLLCCHIADLGAPASRRLSSFAIGRTNRNPVWLAVQKDWDYHQAEQYVADLQYAAHGGLVVYGDGSSGNAYGFHSTLTIGGLQFVFLTRMGWAEQLELRLSYPDFCKWCQSQVRQARASPFTESEQKRLGLVSWK